MLKRRTGIILLTLLFITGLAGTITDNTISKSERKGALALMKDTYKDALGVTSGLSDVQLNYKTTPDKWSVIECMFHIAATEKLLWKIFEDAMKAPANPEKRTAIIVSDEQVKKMAEDQSFKTKAVESIQTKNTEYKSLKEALADLKNSRMDQIKYMKNTTEDLRNHVVQLPVGWLDCYQLYLFIACHSYGHTQQMNEVITSTGFPIK